MVLSLRISFIIHQYGLHIIFDATVGGSSNIIRMIQYIVPSYVLVTQFVLEECL